MIKKILLVTCLMCVFLCSSIAAEELFVGENAQRTDYSAYMNVKIPKDSNGTAMLLFRAKNINLPGYGLSYYEVGFDTGSKISLRKFYTGYYRTYTETLRIVNVDNDGSEKLITVDAVENTFKICLDGEEIINYTDNGTYNAAVHIIPANLTGDIGYHIDGDAQIIDYGSEDYAEEKSHIKSVTITDENGEVIEEGSYIPPETELNYEIEYTENYEGLSIVATEDGSGMTLDTDIKDVLSKGRTGKIVSPSNKKYFEITEFAWESVETMRPLYPKGAVAEFNLKNVYDYYYRKEVTNNEKYIIKNDMYMSGSKTESVDITFEDGSSLQDVAGLVLISNSNSKFGEMNCYRAVIRNKNTVSLEVVKDNVVTVLGVVPVEQINDGEQHNLKLHIYGSRITIHYDNQKIIQYIVPDIFYLNGKAGLYQYGENIRFGQIVLSN